jgi:general secretion pathway protein I
MSRRIKKALARRRAQDGFSLLELIVAFSILSLVLSASFSTYSMGLRNARRAEARLLLTIEAENLMNQMGRSVPVVPGRTTGQTASGLTWTALVDPYDQDLMPEERVIPILPQARGPELVRVEITVLAPGQVQGSVTLETLRLWEPPR